MNWRGGFSIKLKVRSVFFKENMNAELCSDILSSKIEEIKNSLR